MRGDEVAKRRAVVAGSMVGECLEGPGLCGRGELGEEAVRAAQEG